MDRRQEQHHHRVEESLRDLSRLADQTNRAVDALFRGKGGDVRDVLATMRRADDAYWSLLAAREKLLQAGEPHGSMPMQA